MNSRVADAVVVIKMYLNPSPHAVEALDLLVKLAVIGERLQLGEQANGIVAAREAKQAIERAMRKT